MRRLLGLLALLCAVTLPAVAAGPALAAKGQDTKTATTQAKKAAHPAKKTHKAPVSGAKATLGNTVINDCQDHGQLTKTYPKAQLRDALAVMSPTTKQYSNCYDVIESALLHDTKAGGGGSGGSGSSTTTIVIIVVIVLILLAVIFGGLAVRRRRQGEGIADEDDDRYGEPPTQVQPPPDSA